MRYKKETVDGHELIYSSDWIHKIESLSHWSYYWHQAKLVEENFGREQKLLEIGVGTGFLTNYLRSRGQLIQSLDIDQKKKPDICAEASGFDYSSLKLDGVLAFEVFEHIPIQLFEKIIKQLSTNKVPKLLFSVPWNELRVFSLILKVPFMSKIQANIQLPRLKIYTATHFWELSVIPKKQAAKQLISQDELYQLFTENGYDCKQLTRVDNIQFYLAVIREPIT
ncbi:MAG: class I SAM-dependent methyltransferase [Symploca sp. SIO2G7]|nr:class I SAM-dependent methyltransferase [Symploca sp. SIO2G7]